MSKRFRRWQWNYITVDDFNKILTEFHYRRVPIFEDAEKLYKADRFPQFKNNIYIWWKKSTIFMSYRAYGKNYNYATKLDGTDVENVRKDISGGAAYALMRRMMEPKLPDVFFGPYVYPHEHPEDCGFEEYDPVKALQWYDEKRSDTGYIKAWSYDLNSAYAGVMIKERFPDTRCPLGAGVVEKDQVGFNYDFNILVTEGFHATFRFPLMDSPYKKFANYFYNKKQKLKESGKVAESKEFKSILNLAIGALTHHNPLHRTFIIMKTRETMNQIIKANKEHILHCNTDCVVSDCPLDLPVSSRCGDFKLERDGEMFRFFKTAHQWNDERPTKSGPPVGWWRPGDDLHNYSGSNKYYFDQEQELIKEYEKGNEPETN